MFCHNCGKKLDEGVDSCLHCQATVPYPKPEVERFGIVGDGKPLSLKSAFNLSWRLYTSRFRDYVTLTMVLSAYYVVLVIAALLLFGVAFGAVSAVLSGPPSGRLLVFTGVPLFTIVLFGYMFFACLAVGRLYWTNLGWGKPWRASIAAARRSVKTFWAAAILQCLAVYGGLIALGVGMLYTSVRFGLAMTAYMEGSTGGWAALQRSLDITRRLEKPHQYTLAGFTLLCELGFAIPYLGLPDAATTAANYVWLFLFSLLLLPLFICYSVVLHKHYAKLPHVEDLKPKRTALLTRISVGAGVAVAVAYFVHVGLLLNDGMNQVDMKVKQAQQQSQKK